MLFIVIGFAHPKAGSDFPSVLALLYCGVSRSTLLLEWNPFVSFRLLVEPHAVTQGFVIFQMDRNSIFLCTHKTRIDTGVCRPISTKQFNLRFKIFLLAIGGTGYSASRGLGFVEPRLKTTALLQYFWDTGSVYGIRCSCVRAPEWRATMNLAKQWQRQRV